MDPLERALGARPLAFVASLALGAPLRAACPPAQDTAPDPAVQKLFVAQCAQCHGEKGDGQGTTKLDRPARSFLDGGFSYGNTPDAVLRTLTYGIPGSVMPSFASAISEADRRALAAYVISLGPADAIPETKDSVMVVTDRALCARGKLAPIVDKAPVRPRGLLVGTPEGLTFEYRVDDVRLLGVRSGGFCDRRDWRGRGGDALEPLGQLVHVLEGGDPGPMFADATRGALAARFRGTSAHGREVRVESTLVLERDDAPLVLVDESARLFGPRAHADRVPSGYERTLVLRAVQRCSPRVTIARATKAVPIAVSREADPPVWLVARDDDGGFDATTVSGVPASACATGGNACIVRLDLDRGATRELVVRVVPRAIASIDDAEAIKRVLEALGR